MATKIIYVNVTSETNKTCSPAPSLELAGSQAAATLVCFLFMFNAIIIGIYRGKRWFPCHKFALNAFIITMLTFAIQLPSDFFTLMPSEQDQLSKLSGSVFMCVSIAFLMPSIGSNKNEELSNNISLLSIMVLSTVTYYSIQIRNGVIFLFIEENIIILCIMVHMLLMCWKSAILTVKWKGVSLIYNKHRFAKDQANNLLRRLKCCYVYSYISDPQYSLGNRNSSSAIGVLCIVNLLIFIEAGIRALSLESITFYNGVSNYKWCMEFVLITQTIIILAGTFVSCYRWLTSVLLKNPHAQEAYELGNESAHEIITFDNPSLGIYWNISCTLAFPGTLLLYYPSRYLRNIWQAVVMPSHRTDKHVHVFQELLNGAEVKLDVWTVKTGIQQMQRLWDDGRKHSPINLIQLLTRSQAKEDFLFSELKSLYRPNERIKLSYLPLIVLAKLFGGLMQGALKDVSEIIYFIDEQMIPTATSLTMDSSWTFQNESKARFARAMRAISLANSKLVKKNYYRTVRKSVRILQKRSVQLMPDVIVELTTIEDGVKSSFLSNEIRFFKNIIDSRKDKFDSMEKLHMCMESLFAQMLRSYISQLPDAIIKSIQESCDVFYQDRIGLAIKFFGKFQAVEDKFPGLFSIENSTCPEDNAEVTSNELSDEIVVEVATGVLEVVNVDTVAEAFSSVEGDNTSEKLDIVWEVNEDVDGRVKEEDEDAETSYIEEV